MGRHADDMVSESSLEEEQNVQDPVGHKFEEREIVDILSLLLRLKGKEEILEFIEYHFFLVQDICAKGMQII